MLWVPFEDSPYACVRAYYIVLLVILLYGYTYARVKGPSIAIRLTLYTII